MSINPINPNSIQNTNPKEKHPFLDVGQVKQLMSILMNASQELGNIAKDNNYRILVNMIKDLSSLLLNIKGNESDIHVIAEKAKDFIEFLGTIQPELVQDMVEPTDNKKRKRKVPQIDFSSFIEKQAAHLGTMMLSATQKVTGVHSDISTKSTAQKRPFDTLVDSIDSRKLDLGSVTALGVALVGQHAGNEAAEAYEFSLSYFPTEMMEDLNKNGLGAITALGVANQIAVEQADVQGVSNNLSQSGALNVSLVSQSMKLPTEFFAALVINEGTSNLSSNQSSPVTKPLSSARDFFPNRLTPGLRRGGMAEVSALVAAQRVSHSINITRNSSSAAIQGKTSLVDIVNQVMKSQKPVAFEMFNKVPPVGNADNVYEPSTDLFLDLSMDFSPEEILAIILSILNSANIAEDDLLKVLQLMGEGGIELLSIIDDQTLLDIQTKIQEAVESISSNMFNVADMLSFLEKVKSLMKTPMMNGFDPSTLDFNIQDQSIQSAGLQNMGMPKVENLQNVQGNDSSTFLAEKPKEQATKLPQIDRVDDGKAAQFAAVLHSEDIKKFENEHDEKGKKLKIDALQPKLDKIYSLTETLLNSMFQERKDGFYNGLLDKVGDSYEHVLEESIDNFGEKLEGLFDIEKK